MTNNMSFCHLCVNVLGYLPRAPSERTSERKLKMDTGIRQLDAAELDLVAGGGLGASLIKIGVTLIGNLAGSPIVAAAAAALANVVEAAVNAPPQPWVEIPGQTD
jgi:hypothetical protein